MKIIREAIRYLVAALFIFSGLIKLNDPVGTAIKLQEYFEVFSQDFAPFFELFVPAALFLAVFLSVLEVILGVALLLNFRMAATSITLIVLIIFFTGLTFYSAYFNKVTDCGCFGDAIKLTPWQSFYKDVVLLFLIFVIFFNFQNYKEFITVRFQNAVMSVATVVAIVIALLSIRYLPFVDFRSYAVGNNIGAMMIPEETAKYEYVMEKEGQEFRFDTYPTDQSYTYKEAILLNPVKAQPKIADFGVWNDQGEMTGEVLSGVKLIFVIHEVSKTKLRNLDAMKELALSTGVETWLVTSTSYEDFENFRHQQQLSFPVFNADATVLKTMVRSNPGIMLFKNGIVVGKWSHNGVPDLAEVKELIR